MSVDLRGLVGGGIPFNYGDVLQLGVRGTTASPMRLNVEYLDTRGNRQTVTVDQTASTDRSVLTTNKVLQDDGVIYGATCDQTSGNNPSGPAQVYCEAHLFKGGTRFASLLRGYFYDGHVPAFPGVMEGLLDGPGRLRELNTADPAAGSEIAAQATPTNAKWRLQTISVQLIQGITQTPLPSLKIATGAGTVAQIPVATVAIGASTTAQLTWGRGLVQSSFTAVVGDEMYTAPIPEMIMNAGDAWSTVTDGIGANTNYGPAGYHVEEWISP